MGGFTLALCAGMVNAVAFAKFATYVSHVSGSSTSIGLRTFGDQPGDVATPALLVLDFIIGATMCGLIIPKATLKLGKAPYSSALILLALIIAMPMAVRGSLGAHFLALGCGLQNGLCSSWSGNVIRTTHMTGTATDLGLAAGRIISRFLSKRISVRNYGQDDWEEHAADRNKVILMSLLLAGFVGGACAGTCAFNSLEVYTLCLPTGLYCSLSIVHALYAASQKEVIKESMDLEAGFVRQMSGTGSERGGDFDRQLSGASKEGSKLGGIPEGVEYARVIAG